MFIEWFYRNPTEKATMAPERNSVLTESSWPIPHEREAIDWLAPRSRLISLVRNHPDSYVLPPAVIRKPQWRE